MYAFLIAVLSVLWIWGLITIIGKGVIFGVAIPPSLPLWVALLIWFCIYGFVLAPIKAARWASYHYSSGGQGQYDGHYYHPHHGDSLEGIVWLSFFVVLIWGLWNYVPASHIYFSKVQLFAIHIYDKIIRK